MMKTLKNIVSRLGLVAMLACPFLSSCDKSHELSMDNKDKARPVVEAQTMSTDLHDFTIALLPSSDTKYYGCVIMAGNDNTAPDAYDIVTGNVSTDNLLSSKLFASANETAPSIKTQCTYSEDYQVFTAGINENGLLSKVNQLDIHIDNASPSTVIREGIYKLNTVKYNDATNPRAGEPFDVKITRMTDGSGRYILYANWFNLADEGYVCPPYLIGTADYENKLITFDGTRVNSEGIEQSENAFGAMFMDYNSTSKFAFWGGGTSGTDPITITFGDSGYLLSISALSVSINAIDGGANIALYDGFSGNGNETFTFVK